MAAIPVVNPSSTLRVSGGSDRTIVASTSQNGPGDAGELVRESGCEQIPMRHAFCRALYPGPERGLCCCGLLDEDDVSRLQDSVRK